MGWLNRISWTPPIDLQLPRSRSPIGAWAGPTTFALFWVTDDDGSHSLCSQLFSVTGAQP